MRLVASKKIHKVYFNKRKKMLGFSEKCLYWCHGVSVIYALTRPVKLDRFHFLNVLLMQMHNF